MNTKDMTYHEKPSIDDMPELKTKIKDFIENLENDILDIHMGCTFYHSNINELEHEARSGFIPGIHNKGGFDLLCFADIDTIAGDDFSVSEQCESLFEHILKDIKEDNPELDEEDLYFAYREGENDIAFRVRVMFNGESLDIFAGWDFDAPYYRWRGSDSDTFEKLNVPLDFDLDSLIDEIIKTM